MLNFISDIHAKLQGWRTVIWGVVSMIPGLYLEFYDGFRDMGIDLTPIVSTPKLVKYLPFIVIGGGFLTIFFRLITKGRVGDKTPYQHGGE